MPVDLFLEVLRNGDAEAAEAELADVIARREATAGPDDQALCRVREWHAVALHRLGRVQEAETEMAAVIPQLAGRMGEDAEETLRAFPRRRRPIRRREHGTVAL